MNFVIKKITLLSVFIALGVTLGYAFAYIPNVELVTATVFIAGYLLGIKEGLLVGLLAESIYSLFNPYGVAAPPLFIAQVVSMAFTGILGGMCGKRNMRLRKIDLIIFGFTGLISTLIFTSLTTMSFLLYTGLSLKKLMGSFIYGLGFYILHIASNTIIFILIVPVILNSLQKRMSAFYPTTVRGTP